MSKSKTNYIPRDISTSRIKLNLTEENRHLLKCFNDSTLSVTGKQLSQSYLINLIISASLRPTRDKSNDN